MREIIIKNTGFNLLTLLLAGSIFSCSNESKKVTGADTTQIDTAVSNPETCITGFRIDLLELEYVSPAIYNLRFAASNLSGDGPPIEAIGPNSTQTSCNTISYTIPEQALPGDLIQYPRIDNLDLNNYGAADFLGIQLNQNRNGHTCGAIEGFLSIRDTRYPPPTGDTSAIFPDTSGGFIFPQNVEKFIIKRFKIKRDPASPKFTVNVTLEERTGINYKIASISNQTNPNTNHQVLMIQVIPSPEEHMSSSVDGLILANEGSGPAFPCSLGPGGTPVNPIYNQISIMPILIVEGAMPVDAAGWAQLEPKKGMICFK